MVRRASYGFWHCLGNQELAARGHSDFSRPSRSRGPAMDPNEKTFGDPRRTTSRTVRGTVLLSCLDAVSGGCTEPRRPNRRWPVLRTPRFIGGPLVPRDRLRSECVQLRIAELLGAERGCPGWFDDEWRSHQRPWTIRRATQVVQRRDQMALPFGIQATGSYGSANKGRASDVRSSDRRTRRP